MAYETQSRVVNKDRDVPSTERNESCFTKSHVIISACPLEHLHAILLRMRHTFPHKSTHEEMSKKVYTCWRKTRLTNRHFHNTPRETYAPVHSSKLRKYDLRRPVLQSMCQSHARHIAHKRFAGRRHADLNYKAKTKTSRVEEEPEDGSLAIT